MSRMRSRSKALRSSTSVSANRAQRSVRCSRAYGLMARMRASTSRSSSGVTRSVLLSRMTSAKAIWFLASGASLSRSLEPFGVGDGDDGVELGLAADVLVDEEGLRHRRRIGEAGGLDDDGVELALAPHQPVDDADQVAAHGAADAAVVHLEDFLVGADDEVVVDADLAELVDDDGELLAVRLGQDAVEQRGLAGAEIAGEHGDGNFVGHFALRWPPLYRHPAAVASLWWRMAPLRRSTLGSALDPAVAMGYRFRHIGTGRTRCGRRDLAAHGLGAWRRRPRDGAKLPGSRRPDHRSGHARVERGYSGPRARRRLLVAARQTLHRRQQGRRRRRARHRPTSPAPSRTATR